MVSGLTVAERQLALFVLAILSVIGLALAIAGRELLVTLLPPETGRQARAFPPKSRYGFRQVSGDFGAIARI